MSVFLPDIIRSYDALMTCLCCLCDVLFVIIMSNTSFSIHVFISFKVIKVID